MQFAAILKLKKLKIDQGITSGIVVTDELDMVAVMKFVEVVVVLVENN